MSLVRKKKTWLLVVFLLLFVGGYAWYYQNTISRVQQSVESSNNLKEAAFYKNELSYGDLSRKVRSEISKQDFDTWSTWKEVDASFSKLQRPDENKADFVIQVPLAMGTAFVYYDFELTGLKLRYVHLVP